MVEQGVKTDRIGHRSDTTDRARLEALLRVAAAQWAHKPPADQEIERRFIARDFALISDLGF